MGTDGSLGGNDINGLNSLNSIAAEVTFIGTYQGTGQPSSFNNVCGIVYDAQSGRLIGINDGQNEVIEIDRLTGAGTLLSAPVPNLNGLAFVDEQVEELGMSVPEPLTACYLTAWWRSAAALSAASQQYN